MTRTARRWHTMPPEGWVKKKKKAYVDSLSLQGTRFQQYWKKLKIEHDED